MAGAVCLLRAKVLGDAFWRQEPAAPRRPAQSLGGASAGSANTELLWWFLLLLRRLLSAK